MVMKNDRRSVNHRPAFLLVLQFRPDQSAVGNFVRYLVTFLTVPITSRLFPPEDFGIVSVIVSAVTATSVFTGFGYDMAIVGTRRRKDAFELFQLCIVTLSAVSVLLVPLTVIYAVRLNGSSRHAWLWLLFPVFLLWFGLRAGSEITRYQASSL